MIFRCTLTACVAFVGISASITQSSQAHARARATPTSTEITWLGHATFALTSPQGNRFLIDPFLTGNPKTPKTHQTLQQYANVRGILVTHGHWDHLGDAQTLAKDYNIPVVGAFDLVQGLKLPGKLGMGGNVGGKIRIADATIHLVPAMHGSAPDGRPLGFVVEFDGGPTVYHTGDTWLFGDMALIQEIYKPDIIMLNVGGGLYTQDAKTAALAVRKYFDPKLIIPMHFGTFGPLQTAADVDAAFAHDKRLKRLEPGQSVRYPLAGAMPQKQHPKR